MVVYVYSHEKHTNENNDLYGLVTLDRLVRTVPCVAAFMSSLTLIAVAVERKRVILRPHQQQVHH